MKNTQTTLNELQTLVAVSGLFQNISTPLFIVKGKKNGQLVDITEMPMSEDDCYRWIKEQGIENHYTNVFPVPYHGSKKQYNLPL